tara:strand:- start:535 stop:1530 length:996 start_codon:yes stop_codon:yes gene_type:complete
MFEYFYHEILRRTVIGFGTLFNDINIRHTDSSDNTVSELKVPLAYGPTQKFLARLEQVADLNKPTQLSLPRMSFEMIGLNYDSARKVTSTQTFISSLETDKKKARKTFMPVPYNMSFELSVYTKLNDDMLQIVEQILPYFQPSYNLTVDLVDQIGEKRDIPVVFEGITMSDDYEGNYQTRRSLIYTLRFTAKTYLFGPISDPSKDIIKKVTVGYASGAKTSTPSREFTYSVEPRPTKSYSNNIITSLKADITDIATVIEVNDASSVAVGGVLVIDDENFRVASKSGTKITVERGFDSTTATNHVLGTDIKLITSADADLIEFGDNFGFDGF